MGQHKRRRDSVDTAWIGDLMFVASSVLWAAFPLLMRKWRVDPLRATAVVAVLTAVIVVPGYLAHFGTERLLMLPGGALVTQGLAQGLVQGVIKIIAYTKAIAILGVSRAVLFPAILILIGIRLVGEWPGQTQIIGLSLVTLGILTAVGLISRLTILLPVARPCHGGNA